MTLGTKGIFLRNGIDYESMYNNDERTSYKRPVRFSINGNYTDGEGNSYLFVQNEESKAINFWIEASSVIGNGASYQTYYNDPQRTQPQKPGEKVPADYWFGQSSYNNGFGFDQVKFYKARPFEVGMEGYFIWSDKIVGKFTVSEGSTDDKVSVRTIYWQTPTLKRDYTREFSKTINYVNTGTKATSKAGDNASQGMYVYLK